MVAGFLGSFIPSYQVIKLIYLTACACKRNSVPEGFMSITCWSDSIQNTPQPLLLFFWTEVDIVEFWIGCNGRNCVDPFFFFFLEHFDRHTTVQSKTFVMLLHLRSLTVVSSCVSSVATFSRSNKGQNLLTADLSLTHVFSAFHCLL